MDETIWFRVDDETSRALDVLTQDGTSASAAIRKALLTAAREQVRGNLETDARRLVNDEDDRAEALRVLQDMQILRTW